MNIPKIPNRVISVALAGVRPVDRAKGAVGGLVRQTLKSGGKTVRKTGKVVRDVANATAPKCDACGNRLLRPLNRADALRQNYTCHSRSDTFVAEATFVCGNCFASRELAQCAKTRDVFFKRDDTFAKFRKDQAFEVLFPYHPSSKLDGPLSPTGFEKVLREAAGVADRIVNQWAGCVRGERLPGFDIGKKIGTIRAIGRFADPDSVEKVLTLHAAQIGANGIVNFFWKKRIHRHSETYVAGHGPGGNPYYRTRHWTTASYSGHGDAVVATPRFANRRQGGESRRANDGNGSTQGREKEKRRPSDDMRHAEILGISPDATLDEIKRAYRKAMSEYHPDKVAHLGKALRELAEEKAKQINQAYEYFRKKRRA